MNLKVFAFICTAVFFSTQLANAQYLSLKGDFQVDQYRGCSDLTITVTNITPGTGSILFKFEGYTSNATSNPVHTYQKDSTFWLSQTISGSSGQKQDSILITIVAPVPPEIELLSCNNFELLVQINDNYYDVYEVDYGDGTDTLINKNNSVPPHMYTNNSTRNVVVTGLFTTATNRCGITSNTFTPTITVLPAQIDSLIAIDGKTLKLNYQLPINSNNKIEVSVNNNTNYGLFKNLDQNTVVDTISNLNISQNTYCFRIATYDACSNFKSYSNEVCSINLNTAAQNNEITINWNTIDVSPGQTAGLYKDGILYQSLASPIFQHIDSTVICNNTYCFQTEINFGNATSRSLEVCETAFSTDIPDKIDNLSSKAFVDSIEWVWQIPANTAPSYFMVYELNDQGAILKSDSVSTNLYKNSFENNIKYLAVELHNICNNTSGAGNIGSNIYLEGYANGTFDIELSWNNYFGWIDGFQEYYVSIKDTNGNLLDSVSTGGSTSYTFNLNDQIEQTTIFTIWAIPVLSGIDYARSNILTFESAPIISIPNSFTPNGDGLNDKFLVTGKFIRSYELQVFNRWGEVLYQTTDMEIGWDGTSKDKNMPTGNYAYWMRIKDLNNNEHIRTGSILILSN